MGTKLSKAPIAEVVFEIRFSLPQDEVYDYTVELSNLSSKISSDFPNLQSLPTAKLPFGIPDPIVRHRLMSADDKASVLLGETSIGFSELNYNVFESFKAKLSQVITAHKETISKHVVRIGLRYVNQIEVTDTIQEILSFDPGYPDFMTGEKKAFADIYTTSSDGDLMNFGLSYEESTKKLLLDFDYYRNEEKDYIPEEILEWAEKANTAISAAFIASLSPEYFQSLK